MWGQHSLGQHDSEFSSPVQPALCALSRVTSTASCCYKSAGKKSFLCPLIGSLVGNLANYVKKHLTETTSSIICGEQREGRRQDLILNVFFRTSPFILNVILNVRHRAKIMVQWGDAHTHRWSGMRPDCGKFLRESMFFVFRIMPTSVPFFNGGQIDTSHYALHEQWCDEKQMIHPILLCMWKIRRMRQKCCDKKNRKWAIKNKKAQNQSQADFLYIVRGIYITTLRSHTHCWLFTRVYRCACANLLHLPPLAPSLS